MFTLAVRLARLLEKYPPESDDTHASVLECERYRQEAINWLVLLAAGETCHSGWFMAFPRILGNRKVSS